jgi:restriction system protein
MNNPGFQDYFIPVLQVLSNGNLKGRQDIYESAAIIKNLTEDQKREMLPNQSQPTYMNRIGWALTYLKKAGMLSTPIRGKWQITDLGVETLNNPPSTFNVTYLKTYPSFVEFHKSSRDDSKTVSIDNDIPPYENLVESFELLKRNECEELLEKILEQTPLFFEKLVIDLLLKMGYGGTKTDVKNQLEAGKHTGKSGDEGIDGIISEDRLGLDKIYIQAKRWKLDNVVSRPEIQKFIGALSWQRARKGIFITTSRFSRDAIEINQKTDLSIILIDGKKLVELMYEYGVGVSEIETLVIKKIDNDYFEEQ